MRSADKMIVIRQNTIQWQPFYMVASKDFSDWKIRPGYTPRSVPDVYFRRPKVACLFRTEIEYKHMKKAVR